MVAFDQMNRKRHRGSAPAPAWWRRALPAPLVLAMLLVFAAPIAGAQELPRVLFFTKSSTFIQSTIDRRGDQPSYAGRTLQALGERHGFAVDETKDGARINSAELARYRAVVFFTTGDLTVAGERGKHLLSGDGDPPMAPDGPAQLLAWIERGGGFVGFHSAADTFHGEGVGPSPYIAMLGGEFTTHGAPFEGTVRLPLPGHPLIAHIPPIWQVREEWYLFENFDRSGLHVLAVLDPGAEGQKQKPYDRAPYPVVWIKRHGAGRVYYNALGHSEHVWDSPDFQRMVADALWWAMGRGEAGVVPNFELAAPGVR